MSKQPRKLFNSNGTEGMLDVILGCTLIFLLLTALVKVEASNNREITLPEMDLSKSLNSGDEGASKSTKTIISLKQHNKTTQIWIDDHLVSADELSATLKNLGPATIVALRRDRNLSCGIEDKIILECQKAGIQRIAIMLKEEN